MGTFDTLINRNKDFATHEFVTSSSLKPTLEATLRTARALIIACADPRDDPAVVLGFEPGEAVVLRNIGGRITPGTLQMMALLGRIGQVAGENPGGENEFYLIVLHHTDCGIKRLAGNPEMLADYFGIDKEGLPSQGSHRPTSRGCRRRCRAEGNPALPGEWLVSGLVYDVDNGAGRDHCAAHSASCLKRSQVAPGTASTEN